MPLLNKLGPEIVLCLVKITIIATITCGLEIYSRAYIDENESAAIKICLQRAACVITGGLKKADLYTMCADTSLPSAQNILKREAIEAGAHMITLADEHPLQT